MMGRATGSDSSQYRRVGRDSTRFAPVRLDALCVGLRRGANLIPSPNGALANRRVSLPGGYPFSYTCTLNSTPIR